MVRRPLSAVATLACVALLASCGTGAGTPATAPASLSASEQKAYDEATAAVRAYVQTVADIYTGQRTALEDLATVAVQPQRGVAARAISQAQTLGYRSEPVGAKVVLISADPSSVDLTAQPPTVVLDACVDGSAVTAISPAGLRRSGVRERSEYHVVRVDSQPAPGWAVSEIVTPTRTADRTC